MYLFSRMRSKIWGDEAHACDIEFVMSPLDGRVRYYAACRSTMQRFRLTENNCEEVLNDMFYDYCIENAAWMGVS